MTTSLFCPQIYPVTISSRQVFLAGDQNAILNPNLDSENNRKNTNMPQNVKKTKNINSIRLINIQRE